MRQARKAEIAGLEIALFEMLVAARGIELVVAGQMHLAVLADDGARLVDQDRGVEMMPVRRQLRIAEAHRHAGALRRLEQRPRGGVRHLALEPDVGVAAVLVIPAREERGQRQLRIDDEIAALGLPHQLEHARDHGLARVGLLDRAELGGGDLDIARHLPPQSSFTRPADVRATGSSERNCGPQWHGRAPRTRRCRRPNTSLEPLARRKHRPAYRSVLKSMRRNSRQRWCGESYMSTTTITSSEHHPTAWYAEMSQSREKTFWACIGGWMLDAMDVQMFSFAIPAIVVAFAITNADAGLIGTATLLSSAVGGWFAGALSDRVGRVRTLQITIAWFAVFTFLCGFAQSYTQLLIFRALMGFGFGGEWAAAAVLIGEVIRPEHRGKAVGAMQSGWAVGWGVAALLATLFFSVFPPDVRLARAVLGRCDAGAARLLRAALRKRTAGVRANPKQPGSSRQKGELPGNLLASHAENHNPDLPTLDRCARRHYAITTWLPTFLRTERKLTVLGTGGYLAVIIVGSSDRRSCQRLAERPHRTALEFHSVRGVLDRRPWSATRRSRWTTP